MQEMIRVAVDAMGGDNAPAEMVKGAVDAVTLRKDIKVYLVGQQEAVRKELDKLSYSGSQIEVVHAGEVIETAEPPVMAIRKKKAVVHCSGAQYGKGKEGGRLCFRREFRGHTGRRTSHCRKD